MCQFSNLAIGEKVQLTVDIMYCQNCNSPFSYSGNATYSGHSLLDGMLYDCFTGLNTACPGCGMGTGQYLELCKDISYTMELIKIKEEIK